MERLTDPAIQTEKKNIRTLRLKRAIFIIVAFILTIVLMGYSLTLGSSDISIAEAYRAMLSRLFPSLFHVSEKIYTIIWVLRMPRVLVAAIAGISLGMAGCVTQAMLKNPLATPYTLGVSAGAGFGASIWFIFGFGVLGWITPLIGSSAIIDNLSIIANAFIFSLIPALVILAASRRSGMTTETVVLSGVSMSYIFAASNTLLQFFAEDDALRASVFWLVGDLTRAAMWQVPYITIIMLIFFVLNMYLSRDYNIIKMGDEDAKGMGVNVERMKMIGIISACLVTASVISFTGAIGFVSLLAPHISRIFIGGDERFLIPASGLVGASLLILADIAAKSLIAPILLPVGAITALVGGPMLLYLLLFARNRRGSRMGM